MPTTLEHPGRIMRLILRNSVGADVIWLDISGADACGSQGISLLAGYTGLMHTPRTPVRESWSYQEGSTPSDFPRVDERLIDLRLATRGTTPAIWQQIEDLLWTVLTFKYDAILRFFDADGIGYRDLKVRLDRKPTDTTPLDPLVTKFFIWEVTLVACDPFWRAPIITSTWTNSAGTGTGTLALQNPADQDCWVEFAGPTIVATETWTLPDGIAKYPAGHALAGQNVRHTLPALAPGREFFVQTHPLRETLEVRDASQQWAKMRSEEFNFALAPFTPVTTVPVSLVGGNTASSVTAFMTQRWDRPVGGIPIPTSLVTA